MTIRDRSRANTASYMYIYIHDNITTQHRTGGLVPRSQTGGSLEMKCAIIAAAAAMMAVAGTAQATSIMGEVGVTQMQQMIPNLNGAGVTVAQVEASVSSTTQNAFEPNPANAGMAASNFTFFDTAGVATGSYNSAYGSWHANTVASLFYGSGGAGVAPGVSHVDVYANADYYNQVYDYYQVLHGGTAGQQYATSSLPVGSVNGSPTVNSPAVVNQSFAYLGVFAGTDMGLDQYWDEYASRFNTLYVSAIGDGQTTGTSPASYINPPSDMYNGLAVGAYTGTETNGVFSASTGSQASWVGPAYNGVSKPDLVAPGAYTSYTAPIVSGVATMMIQAGRGTGFAAPVGFNASDAAITAQGATAYTTAATDIRTVKALLLNGAVKPTGWTNSYTVNNGTYTYNAPTTTATTPLDPRYGSGVVNAVNSYNILAGGEHSYTATSTPAISSLATVTSAPTASFSGRYSQTASASVPSTIRGWNLAGISASSGSNAVEHYDFNLTGTSANSWDLTATLSWNKNYNASGINHLMLFLLNSSGQQVAASTSMVDNMQQISLNSAPGLHSLAPGQYDLAVEMLGGVNAISTSDTYALAWNFTDPTAVPEPAALAIFAIGLSMFMLPRKRSNSVKQY